LGGCESAQAVQNQRVRLQDDWIGEDDGSFLPVKGLELPPRVEMVFVRFVDGGEQGT
jgi:hypothetical protein